MSDFAAVVLAAGQGTRMKSDLPKVLHPLAGRPMIGHLLAEIGDLGPARRRRRREGVPVKSVFGFGSVHLCTKHGVSPIAFTDHCQKLPKDCQKLPKDCQK